MEIAPNRSSSMELKYVIAKLSRHSRRLTARRATRLVVLVVTCWLLGGPSLSKSPRIAPRRALADYGPGMASRPWSFEEPIAEPYQGPCTEDQDLGTAREAGAEKLLAEARGLWKQGTRDSRKKAIEKYYDALSQLNAAGDHRRDALILNSIGDIYSGLGENRTAIEWLRKALA